MRVKQGLAVVVVLSFALGAAQADWFDNFDGYAPGSINGQGGWKGWDNVPAVAGTVTNAISLSPEQSQAIVGTTDSVHTYTGYTSGQWVYSAQQYVPSTSTLNTSYFILLNQYNDGGPYSWSVQLSFDLAANVVNDDNAAGGENVPLIRGQWVPITVNIDLDTNVYSAYYGATFVATGPWAGAQQAIEAVDLYTGDADVIYYDDLALTPEPASLALLALALVLRRR